MITVLGSINVDLTFRLAQLPSVGETVLTSTFTEAVGGKGANQALAAARDGARVSFVGATGADAYGATARRVLEREGVDCTGLVEAPAPTGLAAIWVDGDGRNKIAVASGANMSVTTAAAEALALSRGDTLVLQMEVPEAAVAAAVARGRELGARVVLNLAPARPLGQEVLQQLDMLVVNEHEAATLAAALGIDERTAGRQAEALARSLGITVIATLGEAGAIAFAGEMKHAVAALAVSPVDTTGAGDCFVGVLAAALDRGAPLAEAMARAAVAASLACTVVGAEPSFPRGQSIDAALVRHRLT